VKSLKNLTPSPSPCKGEGIRKTLAPLLLSKEKGLGDEVYFST